MRTFSERITLAVSHEEAVTEALRDAGWLVEPFGQELMGDGLRALLRGTDSFLRWLPDRVGLRHGVLALFDAKGETERNKTSPNYSIEKQSLHALHRLGVGTGHGVYVVWHDFMVSEVRTLMAMPDKFDGVFRGNGSGTPFYLIPRASVESVPISEL